MSTESSTETRSFAFGKDTIAGCECPAVAAGYSPRNEDDSLVVAEAFDYKVRELGLSDPTSIIPEEDAKKAWIATVEEMEEDGYTYRAEVGREIAEELGWM